MVEGKSTKPDARSRAARRLKFRVRRFEPGQEPRYDTFEVPNRPGLTVLGALFHIQDNLDDSLAFRFSCRGAVCGSCAMLINRVPGLACRAQVGALLEGRGVELKPFGADGEPWTPGEEILVEPLPHLPVLKDLVVDMSRFFAVYRRAELVLAPGLPLPQKELRVSPEAQHELESYTNCVLCAACWSACPVNGKRPEYWGPAALAKLYRFCIDPRDTKRDERLMLADTADGWWACEFHANCRAVCPRGVPPNLAIGRARVELKKLKGAGDGANRA